MDPKQIIDDLGGTSKVAELCDITPQAVSQWKEKGIPKPWSKFLALMHPAVFAPRAALAAAADGAAQPVSTDTNGDAARP